jgi:glucose-6-phosphate isomerase
MIDLIKNNVPDIRFLYDMKDFLYDQKWAEASPNSEIYYMYRGMAKDEKDKELARNSRLRYDITIIPAKMLGSEFVKTIGHDHAVAPDTNITYAEIYEVLKGKAYFLLQKYENGKIADIYAVRAKEGEKCIVPPNYGHVTINASGDELIMANWFNSTSKSDYSLFKNHQGAGYYATKILGTESLKRDSVPVGTASINWLKNEKYGEVPELKIYQASDFLNLLGKFNIAPTIPMYNLVNDLGKLDFLKNPQNYQWD